MMFDIFVSRARIAAVWLALVIATMAASLVSGLDASRSTWSLALILGFAPAAIFLVVSRRPQPTVAEVLYAVRQEPKPVNRALRGGAFVMLLCLGGMTTVAAEEGGRYREFELGTTVASVTALTGLSDASARTIHARPALLQELAWRRSSATTRATDPVQTMVFSFYNDQLSRIVVDYDRQRTAGMTSADLIAALSLVYGERLLAARKTDGVAGSTADEFGVAVATWRQPGQAIALHVSSFQPAFRLVITSPSLDALAQIATADARMQDRQEAPQRELERRQRDVEAARVAQEKARGENRPVFRP